MANHRPVVYLFALAFILGAARVRADTITGHCQNSTGANLGGVTCQLSNGQAAVTTNFLGNFTITCPAGIYDLTFTPNFASPVAATQRQSIVVAGTLALGNIVMVQGITVTGTVLTSAGVLSSGSDVDFIDAVSNVKLFTPNDNTIANGTFSIVVPAGVYYIDCDGATGSTDASTRAGPFTISAATNVGSITLQPGVAISGTLRNSATNAVLANVDIDVFDEATGLLMPTADDNTNASGVFTVNVPLNRTYRITFDPPFGMLIAGKEVYHIPVAATPLNFGNILLTPGVLVSGSITAGSPAVLQQTAHLAVYRTNGNSLYYASNDYTLYNGTFQIVLPPDNYYFVARPPVTATTPFVATKVTPAPITAATALGAINLPVGVTLSGTVTASFSGLPESGADIDVVNAATGALVWTVNDLTNGAGQYSVVVPNNATYNVKIKTKKASLAADKTLANVAVAGNTVANTTLSMVQAFVYVVSSAGVSPLAIPNGQPLFINVALYNPTGVPIAPTFSVTLTDPQGATVNLFPNFPISFAPGNSLIGLFVPITLPAIPAANLGYQYKFSIKALDPITLAELDGDDIPFTVN